MDLATGSASKGNGGRYWYYHCHHCGQSRFRAETASIELAHYLNQIKISPEVATLYEHIIEDLAHEEKSARSRKVAQLRESISSLEQKLVRATDMFVEGELDRESYQRYRSRCQEELGRLRLDLEQAEEPEQGFAEQLRYAVELLSRLGDVYAAADYRVKHILLGSIFPKKLIYKDGSFRTSPKSDIIALLSGKTQKTNDADPLLETGILSGCPVRIRT